MILLDAIYVLLAAVTSPWWARKPRSGWRERLGHGDPLPETDRPRVLLHAVSVGEVQALRSLVPRLADDADVVVSVGTDTGIARARALFGHTAHVVRYPLDFSWAVKRFLDRVRPSAVGLVELELWPNFLGACRARSIPVGVINGRLSDRSFRGYRRFRWALGPLAFGRLAFADAQDERYAERFRAMGVPEGRVRVTGSMKWDSVAAPRSDDDDEHDDPSADETTAGELARALGIDRARPLVVAGSTAEDEEALLHAACGDDAQLLCAPRKPDHFDAAANAMPGCVRRSEPGSGDPSSGRFLLDTIGELSTAYRLADVVVLGRSFGALYGSDPAEPAALGKPVLIGPRHADFTDAVRRLGDAGGLRVVERESLRGEVLGLIRDDGRRALMGERAAALVESARGASATHAEHLLSRARGTSARGPSSS